MGQAIMSMIGAAVGAAVGSAGGIYGGMLIERFRRREAYRLKVYEQMVKSVSEVYSSLDTLSYSFLWALRDPNDPVRVDQLLENTHKCLVTLTYNLVFMPKGLYDALDILTEKIHDFSKVEHNQATLEAYSVIIKALMESAFEAARNDVGTTDLLADFPDIIRTRKQKAELLRLKQKVAAILAQDQEQENKTKED